MPKRNSPSRGVPSFLRAMSNLSEMPALRESNELDVSGTAEKSDSIPYTPSEESPPEIDDYPDGGLRAWMVVCGTMCTTFSTFGYVNAWGVFQAYYETHLLKSSSPSNIAWIGSVQYCLVFLPGLLVGRIFDLGWFRLPFALGSVTVVVSAFLVAECKVYWQFLLCQGILVGVSSGVCFGPIVAIVGHWFKRRRGLVLGVTALGSSTGGTVFPIAARRLIPQVGFPWTMRILGFIMLCTLGIANLTLKRRLPAKNIAGGLFNPKAFKIHALTVYCFSILVAFLGMYSLLTFIDISATSVGVAPNFSFYLVSIGNACSGIGRLSTALVVDKLGAINMIVPMTSVAAIATYVWPFVRTKDGLIAITVLYGFMIGAYTSSFQLPMYDLGDINDVGRRAGMCMTFAAIGSIMGPPIAGAINNATGGFSAVGFYAGSMMLLSCVMMAITRQLVLRKFLGKC